MSRRRVGGTELWVERGGRTDGPLLLLMHGLSGTGAIWAGVRALAEARWPGRILVPDMRGHGRSAHAASYGIANHAADMAALLLEEGGGETEVVLTGHSMGGLVGMLLASGWFGLAPKVAIGVGVKVDWSAEEHAGIAKLAAAPVRYFETGREVRERFVLVTGLKGIADPADDWTRTGVVEENGGWRLAADNRAAAVAFSDTRDIYRAARAPIVLAAGEHDAMVPGDALRSLDPAGIVLPGLGHNAHVEAPDEIWKLIAEAAGATS